jgi:hypothetical protein
MENQYGHIQTESSSAGKTGAGSPAMTRGRQPLIALDEAKHTAGGIRDLGFSGVCPMKFFTEPPVTHQRNNMTAAVQIPVKFPRDQVEQKIPAGFRSRTYFGLIDRKTFIDYSDSRMFTKNQLKNITAPQSTPGTSSFS